MLGSKAQGMALEIPLFDVERIGCNETVNALSKHRRMVSIYAEWATQKPAKPLCGV